MSEILCESDLQLQKRKTYLYRLIPADGIGFFVQLLMDPHRR